VSVASLAGTAEVYWPPMPPPPVAGVAAVHPRPTDDVPAVLALDAASPIVSVAVARPAGVLAERREEIARSSVLLLGMVDGALAEAGVTLGELAGLVALAGPGSFTGLRIGMATVLGLHQATGLPATAVPTLEILARLAPAGAAGRPVAAAVDVLRDEWAMQLFAPVLRPLGPPARLSTAELVAQVERAGAVLIGFGVARLAPRLGPAAGPAIEPAALAGAAALAAVRHPPSWDAGRLSAPLYFRPPAATPRPTAGPARSAEAP